MRVGNMIALALDDTCTPPMINDPVVPAPIYHWYFECGPWTQLLSDTLQNGFRIYGNFEHENNYN